MSLRFPEMCATTVVWVVLSVTSMCADDVQKCGDLAEATQRLASILGSYNPVHQTALTFPIRTDVKRTIDPGAPEVHIVSSGTEVIGNPFPTTGGVAFDVVTQWTKSVFDLQADGTERLARTQASYSVVRYTITRVGPDWLYHARILSNGGPQHIDKHSSAGSVEWLAEGVRLIGVTGLGEYYGPDGTLITGLSKRTQEITRQQNEIVVRTESLPFAAKRDESGRVLPVIDESRPLGGLFVEERRSSSSPDQSQPPPVTAVERPASVDKIYERISSLMASPNRKLQKIQLGRDGQLVAISFPVIREFHEVAPKIYEANSELTIQPVGQAEGTVKKPIRTQLSSAQEAGATTLSEVQVDASGNEVGRQDFEVTLWGQHGFISRLPKAQAAQAKPGDWLSTEWTKLDDGKIIGINRFHESDHITVWETIEADASHK